MPIPSVVLAVLAQLGPTPPFAPPPLPGPIIRNPDWLQLPTGRDMEAAYPEAAWRDRVEGRVILGCRIDAGGRLVNCAVESEDKPEYGFGAAALGISLKFRMRSRSQDGTPVEGGMIRLPLRFTLPADAPPAPPPK